MIKRALLEFLFACGALSLYHRFRNKRALTVIALHRVLPPSDLRWQTCDPLYTLSEQFFEQCLDFLERYYSLVSLGDLERARRAESPLPPRPLLLTFDDGWADNHRYVLPILKRRGVPAVLFAAADAIDRKESFFQEQLIAAWRAGRLQAKSVHTIWESIGRSRDMPADALQEIALRSLIAALQAIEPDRRREVLAPLHSVLADEERQMLSSAELVEMHRGGFSIGTHGKRHEPLPFIADLDAELRDAKTGVARALGVQEDEVDALSFPFSKYDASVVERARSAGYRLLFGGGLSLTPIDAAVPDLVSRVGITQGEVADASGNLHSAALAAYLFRRPHRALQPT